MNLFGREVLAVYNYVSAGSDRAVSPVIGVVLLVGITVILGAVVGSFAFTETDLNTIGNMIGDILDGNDSVSSP